MPLFLLLVGILFLTASVRGTHKLFFETIVSDFTGPGNFFFWGIALWVIIAVGYFKPLKPFSDAFLALVMIMLFFANRGFFEKFMEIMGGTETAQIAPVSPSQAPNVILKQIFPNLKGF